MITAAGGCPHMAIQNLQQTQQPVNEYKFSDLVLNNR